MQLMLQDLRRLGVSRRVAKGTVGLRIRVDAEDQPSTWSLRARFAAEKDALRVGLPDDRLNL